MNKLTSPHPRLIPALYAWLMENFEAVHLYIHAPMVGDPFLTPMAQSDVLVLNITAGAITNLHVDETMISFGTRFNRKHYDVMIPNNALLGIMGFDKHEPDDGHYVSMLVWSALGTEVNEPPPPPPKSHLRVVK